jgi:hypothetical protein
MPAVFARHACGRSALFSNPTHSVATFWPSVQAFKKRMGVLSHRRRLASPSPPASQPGPKYRCGPSVSWLSEPPLCILLPPLPLLLLPPPPCPCHRHLLSATNLSLRQLRPGSFQARSASPLSSPSLTQPRQTWACVALFYCRHLVPPRSYSRHPREEQAVWLQSLLTHNCMKPPCTAPPSRLPFEGA